MRVRSAILRSCLLPAVFFMSACAAVSAPDSQVPVFARARYEPFSRSAAIAIAEREWRVFGSPINDKPQGASAGGDGEDEIVSTKPEREQGLWQRIGEYWWTGMSAGTREGRWTGKHDERGDEFAAEEDSHFAWSAAFISYVMRIAGAGREFPYSASHSDYINIAASGPSQYAVMAEDPATYAPVPGDLICLGRGTARNLRFIDLPTDEFPSHCDIVVAQDFNRLEVIGGNVGDAVTKKHVPLSDEGLLFGDDGTPVDKRYHWFVVIRVRYQVE